MGREVHDDVVAGNCALDRFVVEQIHSRRRRTESFDQIGFVIAARDGGDLVSRIDEQLHRASSEDAGRSSYEDLHRIASCIMRRLSPSTRPERSA